MFVHQMAAGENDSGVLQELAAIGHEKSFPCSVSVSAM
jgi:hypothetical protein